MNQKLIYLTEAEFNSRGSLDGDSGQYTMDDLVFKEVKKFFHEQIQEALKKCRQYTDRGLRSIIVNSKNYVIVWEEIRAISEDIQEIEEETLEKSSVETVIVKQYRGQTYEVEKSKISADKKQKQVRHYRGQTYETEVPSIEQKKPKKRRKYRGYYID